MVLTLLNKAIIVDSRGRINKAFNFSEKILKKTSKINYFFYGHQKETLLNQYLLMGV